MKTQDQDNVQIARGTAIAQATDGATASVSVGFTAAEVQRLLASVMEGMVQGPSASTTMVLAIPQLNLEGPVRPEPVLKRIALESQIEAAFLSLKAVSLRGDVGSGRTELARSATETHTRVQWLDLQANQHLLPEVALELFLRSVSADENALKGTTLVLDNVDDAILKPQFEARLRALAGKGEDGPSLILISLHPLPRTIAPLFEEIEVKRLDNKEIRELMSLYRAPRSAFQDGLVDLVEGVTHGMPDLVALLLKDWQSKNWKLDDARWEDLLRSNFAKALRAETQRRLLAMEERESSELLYRLTLLGRDFNEKEVVAIAALAPPIQRARERLYSLSGRWLHRIKGDRWRTSPVVAGAGDGNLLFPIRAAVHTAAANWLFAKRILNQIDVQQAIMHLLQAGKHNEAGVVYIRALHSLLEAEPDVYPGMLLSLWKSLPLPGEMDLGLRIFIRGLQIANSLRRGEDCQHSIDDLTSLIKQARDWRDQVSVYAASGLVGMQLAAKDAVRALPFISYAALGERQVPVEARGYLNDHAVIEIFWVAAMNATSKSAVLAWVNEVGMQRDEERKSLMVAEFAPEAATKMFDSLWWREQDLPDGERDWPSVLECLRQCEEIVSPWNIPLLMASILRSRLSVRIVHLKEIDDSQKEAEQFFAANQNDELATFILADGAASWFIDADCWDLAATWLTRAYAYDGSALPLHRQLNSLRYGHLLLREGAPSIVPFERAIAIGESSHHLTLFNELKARAEMATFLWKTGRTIECYLAWCKVVRGLLEHREDSNQWKHFFVMAANNTAFYCSALARSKVDEQLVTEPRPGMFIGNTRPLAELYQAGIVFLMPGGMAQWADDLGRERDASDWAERAGKFAQDAPHAESALMYKMHAIPLDIKEYRFVEAMRHGNETSLGMLSKIPLPISEKRRAELKDSDFDMPSARQDVFARLVRLHLGLFPALLEIGVQAELQPANVRSQLEDLRSEAQRMKEDDSESWGVGIEVLDEILAGQLQWAQLRNSPPTGTDGRGDVRSTLRCFGLWIRANESASDLLIAQAACVPFLAAYFPQMGQIGTTICQSIARMWTAKIEHSPYHFRRSTETIGRVNQLATEARLGDIIMVLADSVGMNIKTETRQQFGTYMLRKQ